MMDVLIEPADQSRNAQSPEGLLPHNRPDQVRASRRRDLAIGRGWTPETLVSDLCLYPGLKLVMLLPALDRSMCHR